MSCGDFVSVFQEDPQDMPGQGLARTDNYNGNIAAKQYQDLLSSYLMGEQNFGPDVAAARLKTLNTTLTGTNGQRGAPQLYLDTMRLADPEGAALLDTLTATASSDLKLDNQLDPNQLRLVEQSSRASAAARGMGYGPSDAFAETFAKLGYGENLRSQRRDQALTIAKLRSALAQRPTDMAYQASFGDKGNMALLSSVYSENQAGNRTQADLETKIGMDEANKWNSWGSFAAGAI